MKETVRLKLTGESLASVRQWDVESLTRVSNIYADIADHKELFHPIIEWKGQLYGYSSIKKCSLGEYIDLETYSADMENSMHKVAAILYRPIKKHRFESIMFGLFKKDPRKKLQTQYEKLLYDAMVLQRSGDIMGYSTVTEQANAVLDQIVLLDAGEKA